MDDKIYASAVRMLAGREHSRHEIKNKLLNKGHDLAAIEEVIEQCIQDKYLSETRFTETFVSSKINRGTGPIKIKMELQQRGVDESLIDEYLDFNKPEWFEHAVEVRCKRFGKQLPYDINDKAKQIRFLQQRGFTQAQIMSVLDNNPFDD